MGNFRRTNNPAGKKQSSDATTNATAPSSPEPCLQVPFHDFSNGGAFPRQLVSYMTKRLAVLATIIEQLTQAGWKVFPMLTGMTFTPPKRFSQHDIDNQLSRLGKEVRLNLMSMLTFRTSPKHKQVDVKVGERSARVDEEMALLITELWKAGINTTMSCQENCPGIAWLVFTDATGAKCFLDIVSPDTDRKGDLYDRIVFSEWNDGVKWPKWEFEMRVLDLTLTEARAGDHVVRRYGNPPDIQFEIALRLPRLHLPLVIERMQRHNRRRAPGTGGKSRLP